MRHCFLPFWRIKAACVTVIYKPLKTLPLASPHDGWWYWRGQQPTPTSLPELLEAHTPRRVAFFDEQRRDEEPRHHEEDVDTDVPSVEPGHPCMEEKHQENRDSAQTLDVRPPLHTESIACTGIRATARVRVPPDNRGRMTMV